MSKSIRPFHLEDKTAVLAMAQEFYHSDAVLHPIPQKHLEETFDLIVAGSPYAEGFMMEFDKKSRGVCINFFDLFQ